MSNTSSSNSIIDGTNIDLSVFSYSAPKPNPSGGKVVNLYNKIARESLTISAPLMGAWSAQELKLLDGTATGKYTISLQFSDGEYASHESALFLDQLKVLEHKIKEDAMVQSKDWFGKAITSMDVIDEKFNPMLKYPKISKGSEERDYTRKPSLTVKLPCFKDVWQTSVFDEDYNPLYIKGKSDPDITPLNFLTSAGKMPIQVLCLLQCAGIWIVNSKVSITWNLKQVVVKKPKMSSISDDTCFLNIREQDRDTLKALPDTEPVVITDNSIAAAVVYDTDDDDTQQQQSQVVATPVVVEAPVVPVVVEEPVAVVAPAPVPEKKKIVSKKKPTDA